MKVSVVIPTYCRPQELNKCLEAILIQTSPPIEVIVIDNGPDEISKPLVQHKEKDFLGHGVSLRYIKNNRNSLTAARNLGAKSASGKIILFLDDDTIPSPDYIQQLLQVYETTPNALGVQGYIPKKPHGKLRDLFHRSFFGYHLEKNLCRVLPSVSATYPVVLDGVTECQWLSGANHSYKRQILEEFQYDEQLIKYCDGEDLEFSYRVFKRYPGQLFITPFALLSHSSSMTARAQVRERVYMREVYNLYLFFKLFDNTLKNKSIYLWSRIGWLLLTLARLLIKQKLSALSDLKHLLGAFYMCLRHFKEIKKGNLQFFNRTL